MLSHNAVSLSMYQFLLDDTQKEIDYWSNQPVDATSARQLENFFKLQGEHQVNFDRVKKQAEDDGEDIAGSLEDVVEWFGWLIREFGQWLPDKETLTKIINAAKKLIEIFNKK